MILRFITLAIFIVTFALNSPAANAGVEQWFKKSVITVTDLSEVPGVVLEPGTYVLKAEEGPSSPRTVVQLLNQDESQTLATFMAVPDHRQRPDFEAVVTYFSHITNGPKPIQTWFYPGEMNGYEFVYPMNRAREIARNVDDHVMASETRDGSIVALTRNLTQVPIFDPPGGTKAKLTTEEPTREKPQSPAISTPAEKKSASRARNRQP